MPSASTWDDLGPLRPGVYALSLATQLLFGRAINLSKHQLAGLIVVLVWGFIYFAYQWTLGGRTVGMALFGLQAVGADGSPITSRQAVVRTLALPLSFLILPLALLMILIQHERRPLHDLIGHTRRRLRLGRPGGPTAVAGPEGEPPGTAAPELPKP